MIDIKIAKVCGLCAGCTLAINTTIQEINKGSNVTIFKEIVHNKNVNNKNASKSEVNFNCLHFLCLAVIIILRTRH